MDYPRVTEILKHYTSYESVPKDILERASARGTTVHALCAGIAKGAWIPDGMIAEEYKGYIKSFNLWKDAQVFSFDIIEKRYMDDKLGYTGQLDFVVTATDGKKYLVDLKTSAKPQKTYPIQMAAYEALLRTHQITVDGAWLVYLKKDGEFPDIHVIDNLDDERHIFWCALDCWKYFNKRKKKDDKRDSAAA